MQNGSAKPSTSNQCWIDLNDRTKVQASVAHANVDLLESLTS